MQGAISVERCAKISSCNVTSYGTIWRKSVESEAWAWTTIQTYLHNKQGDADILRQADGSSEVPS